MPDRSPYLVDPTLFHRVFDLLDVVFPGLRGAEAQLRAWGFDWRAASQPFVHEQGGRVLTHVGVIEMPLVIEGRPVPVGSVHGVATHPEHRRRGLFRQRMEECLDWCDARYDTLELTTAEPAMYEPFGFREVPEHRFLWEGRCGGDNAALRRLDLDQAPDRADLFSRLEGRAPVSSRLGVRTERNVFLYNVERRPLWHVAELDLLVVAEEDHGTLRLWDVVAPRMPSFADLVAALPRSIARLEVYFCPDLLQRAGGSDLTPEPHLLDGDDHLMVRGPYAQRPLMLPRTARS